MYLYSFQTSEIEINKIMNSFYKNPGYSGHTGIDTDANRLMYITIG